MPDHDSSYKLFFSFPLMVEDLVRQYIRQSWVAGIDFSTLERVPTSFVTDNLEQRHDDVICRVRWADRWLYVYLLIEFQSTVDPFMALRMIVYVALLCQELIKQGLLTDSGHLPPIFPIVLYNGDREWTAARDVSELFEPAPGGSDEFRLQGKYHLIAISEYAESELPAERNLAAALFRLENSRTPAEIRQAIGALIRWLAEPEYEGMRRAFTVWLQRVLLPRRVPGVKIPELQDLKEAQTMLAERVQEWTREWREQGLEDGRQEGEATIVERQLDRKFGPLSEEDRQRVRKADAETLLEWSDRLLTAERLTDVFA